LGFRKRASDDARREGVEVEARGGVPGIVGRFGWGLADQVFSSLSNFALTFLVARSVDVPGFGVFALAFAVYLTALGLGRAAITSPLSIRYSTRPEEWHEATRAAAGAALVLGTGLGLLCAVVGWLIGGELRPPLLVLGVLLPALLLQDSWRFAFFAHAKGHHAFANDVVWAVTVLPLVAALSASGADEPAVFIAAWGGTAAIASAVGAYQARAVPQPARAMGWWRQHRDLSDWFVGEFAAIRGPGQLANFWIAGFLGLGAVGALRAGNVLMGPVNTVLMGLVLVAVPEGAKTLATGPARLERTMLLISGGLTALAGAWGAALLLLPDAVGTELLGATWDPTQTIIVPLSLRGALMGAAVGFTSGLRALSAGRETFRARVYVTALGLSGVFAGAVISRSASGVVWGQVAAASLSLFVWWRAFRRALDGHTPESPGSAGPGDG
jgi:O-antigen/teichoic acid export membrane protein